MRVVAGTGGAGPPGWAEEWSIGWAPGGRGNPSPPTVVPSGIGAVATSGTAANQIIGVDRVLTSTSSWPERAAQPGARESGLNGTGGGGVLPNPGECRAPPGLGGAETRVADPALQPRRVHDGRS